MHVTFYKALEPLLMEEPGLELVTAVRSLRLQHPELTTSALHVELLKLDRWATTTLSETKRACSKMVKAANRMGNAENKPDEDKPDANQARVDKVRVMKPAVKPAVTRPNAADVLEHHADEIMSLKPALACHVEEMVASRPHSKDDTTVTIVETLLVGFILGRDIGLDGVSSLDGVSIASKALKCTHESASHCACTGELLQGGYIATTAARVATYL